MQKFTIKVYTDIDIEEVLALYDSAGWTNYTTRPDMLEAALRQSLQTLAAYVGDRMVGILRAVGDGHSILYVQDIIVLPAFQRQGIGKALLREIDTMYAQVYQKVLLTDDQVETVHFYASCGFMQSSDYQCVAFVKFNTASEPESCPAQSAP